MSAANINAVQAAELVRHSMQIADQAVVCDIETGAVPVRDADDRRWYDVRPMLDEREHCTQMIDMATQGLAYALMRGLVQRHPTAAHLVRITRNA
jgi:hypothetical protein